jgi:hypothetical protein
MNIKVVSSSLSGIVIIIAIILLAILVAPDVKAQEGEIIDDTSSVTDNSSIQDLIQIFQHVESEIKDPDIKAYYIKLISEYNLNESAADNTEPGSTDAQAIFPNIRKIQETALTLPFQEAGKKIRDEEIREFYYKFLIDTGLMCENIGG